MFAKAQYLSGTNIFVNFVARHLLILMITVLVEIELSFKLTRALSQKGNITLDDLNHNSGCLAWHHEENRTHSARGSQILRNSYSYNQKIRETWLSYLFRSVGGLPPPVRLWVYA